VYLCDYYYFAYALLAAAVVAAFAARAAPDETAAAGVSRRSALAVFLLASAATTGILLVLAAYAQWSTPFVVGRHDPRQLSLDVLAPFVPGGRSRYRAWDASLWQALGPNVTEQSVYVGLGAVALAACAVLYPRPERRRLAAWCALLAVFTVLALGPRLRVLGVEIAAVPLPYAWLDAAVPFMRLSGVPVRAFVVATLALAVLCAAGVRALLDRGRGAVAVALVAVAALETLPAPLPLLAPPPSRFAAALAAHPDDDAYVEVTDTAMPPGLALYYQTVHRHPMAFGHTSRRTAAIVAGEQRLAAAAAAHDWTALRCEFRLRWVVADAAALVPAPSETTELWDGRPGRLYDLAAAPGIVCDAPAAR
jgi:hypothetical protein